MVKITLELIQQLRDRTGVGMLDCKNALTESGGDIEKAIELLRKKGAALAIKRSGNAMAEGIVQAYIHPGSRVGVLVEVDCETDFVARTDVLKQFASDLCLHIAALKPLYISPDQVDAALLDKERAIFKAQLEQSGKPENVIAQIVEGKINKFYAEVCLLQQSFVKNDKLTVDDTLKEIIAKLGENIKIRRFVRFDVAQ